MWERRPLVRNLHPLFLRKRTHVVSVDRPAEIGICELDRQCMQHAFASYSDSLKLKGPVTYACAQV